MLSGEYLSTLGDKNRVAVPKTLRNEIEGKVVITRGFNRTLIIFGESQWQKFISNLQTKQLFNEQRRDLLRYFVGGSAEVSLDSQGRFVIPESLLRFANFSEKIVFLGVGDWIEIWDQEKWYSKLYQTTESLNLIANTFDGTE